MKRIWLSDERVFKQRARERVVNCTPRQSILLLPGYRCDDLKLALEKEIITPNTTVILVEREKEVYYQILNWIKDNWKFEVPPLVINQPLCEITMLPIDLGYFDYFGNLTKEDYIWIKNQLIPNIMYGCNMHFTFCMTPRGNSFIQQVCKTVSKLYADDYYTMMNELIFERSISKEHCGLAATYYILFQKGFFNGYDFNIEFYPYKDVCSRHTMLLISLLGCTKNYDS